MARRVVWSPEALEDIEQIATYIERDSFVYAQAVVSRVFELADSLAELPMSGRLVPELRVASIRERFVYSYRLLFKSSRIA